jgi:lipooligosaccharide transport system permease protein
MMHQVTLRGAGAIWLRQFTVWRQLLVSSVVTNILNPLLFLLAFGFGLGAVITRQGGVDYLSFVVPGMACYSVMFVASFETTISAYARYSLQRTWDAVLATPITLTELLMGEALWAATKAMLTVVCVLIVGTIWGGIASVPGALLALPVLFLAGVSFACQGLLCTAHAKSFEAFSYFFTFWTTPMFVFSGVFFELTRFPAPIRALAWLLPMPHLLAIVRPLTTGVGIGLLPLLGHLAYLSIFFVVPFLLARRRVAQRMFD